MIRPQKRVHTLFGGAYLPTQAEVPLRHSLAPAVPTAARSTYSSTQAYARDPIPASLSSNPANLCHPGLEPSPYPASCILATLPLSPEDQPHTTPTPLHTTQGSSSTSQKKPYLTLTQFRGVGLHTLCSTATEVHLLLPTGAALSAIQSRRHGSSTTRRLLRRRRRALHLFELFPDATEQGQCRQRQCECQCQQ